MHPQTNQEEQLIVPGGYGRKIRVNKGQFIGIVDLEGGQCGDFWAFDAGDLDHYLSPAHTWLHISRIQPRVGDELVTNRREPILTIIRDDVGWHDMLAPACDPQRYAIYYGVTDHRSCAQNLQEAMSDLGWGDRNTPQPFNLFMNTFVQPDGTLEIRDPISKAGDQIVFRAEMDLIVVLSACPMDLNPVSGGGITDLAIRVRDSAQDL
jgi:uncharacterized protein YcgI (DUF1989 family)